LGRNKGGGVVKYLIIVLSSFLIAPTLWADNTGEQDPASSAQEGSPTTAWTNIDSVFTSNDQRASYTGTTFDTIYVTNFSMGVTADATIDSIFVTIEAQGSASQSARRKLKLFLTKLGTTVVGSFEQYTHAQDTDDIIRKTGATNPLWNATWTAAEVNASTFGVILWKTASQAGTILLDHVTIYIAFTEAGGEVATARRRIILGNQ